MSNSFGSETTLTARQTSGDLLFVVWGLIKSILSVIGMMQLELSAKLGKAM